MSGSGNRTQAQTGVGGKISYFIEAVSAGWQKGGWIRRWLGWLGWLMWCLAAFLSAAADLMFQCAAWLLAAEDSEGGLFLRTEIFQLVTSRNEADS